MFSKSSYIPKSMHIDFASYNRSTIYERKCLMRNNQKVLSRENKFAVNYNELQCYLELF